MQKDQISYAAYVEQGSGSASSKGDSIYSGKSDGLERRYFGPDRKAAEEIIKAARQSKKDYRLDEMFYESFGPGLTTCKVKTLKIWPMTRAQRYASG